MSIIFILLCTSILVHISVSVDIWEFGHQVEGDQVIEYHKSAIEATEKTKHIQLHVPTCSRLTYVKVMIDNLVTSPKVLFDKNMNLVAIAYGLYQNSWSTYHVVVKAINDRCNKNRKPRKPKKTTKNSNNDDLNSDDGENKGREDEKTISTQTVFKTSSTQGLIDMVCSEITYNFYYFCCDSRKKCFEARSLEEINKIMNGKPYTIQKWEGY